MKSNHSHSTKEFFELCRMTSLSLGALSKNVDKMMQASTELY